MRRIIALSLVIAFVLAVSGCGIIGNDPSPTLTEFRDELLSGRETAIKDLFVFPASIKAEIFNCEQEENFTFKTDLEDHFGDLFDQKNFIDITIQEKDTVEDGDDSALSTATWHIKWNDGTEKTGSWEATFGMEKVGGGLIQRGEWKIKSIIFE